METLLSSPASTRNPFSSRTAWILVLALSPLAYLASFYLAQKLPSRNTTITINRERALDAAVRFAQSRQIDVRNWFPTIGSQKDDEFSMVLAHPHSQALELVAAASTVAVRFRSPDSGDWFRVQLTPAEHVIGFSLKEPSQVPATISDTEAEKIASTFLRDFLGPSTPFTLGAPRMHFVDQAKQDRMFEWPSSVPGFSVGKLLFRVELAGDRVVKESSDVTVHSSYLNQLRPAPIVYYCMTLAGLYMTAIGIYAIVRYVRRTFDKEISHRRTLLVAVVFVTFSAFTIYYGAAQASLSVNGAPPTSVQKTVLLGVFVVMFSLGGAFFGMAYGAGEGDVRTVYPGKLTSLDALLSGKLFSFNVTRSILAGGAFAGAMLLVQNLALLAVHASRPVEDNDIVSSLIATFPRGHAFSATAMHAVAVAAFGLLLPIAFLRPRVRNEKLFYVLLPLCPILSASTSADSSTWRNYLIAVSVSAAVTCIPFFFGDLLASLSGVVAFDIVSKMIYRSASVERWKELSLPVIVVGVTFLIIEIWFAERGRVYEDWEVRPLYARHLAERLSLQAEIGAARQAQIRLLPDVPPRIVGLSIAGSCVPAREVGGDFYDLYALDDHRLGVFVAEGGNRELASAMPIALAKGYLLYTVRMDLTPVEVLRRLRELLERTLHNVGGNISMIYAVIDARAATIRYARTGDSPTLAINGNRAVEDVAARGQESAIHHGAASISQEDTLLFYTDGLAAQIAERKSESVGNVLARTAARHRDGSATEVHLAILQAAIRRMTEPPMDDVTAVVIRLEKPAVQALSEVV
ncbi:MAG TPA: SpoIIE family protein phosphatase [Bryobacteraceae bacterium]|nr:SpoIIE family protein phosphatase [Bryobacteraceae bacterium]